MPNATEQFPDDLAARLRALPKVELHRHLEGSLRLGTLLDIARTSEGVLPQLDADTLRRFVQMMPDEPYTPERFLSKFHTLRQFYRSPAIIERVAYEAVEDAAADNIRYMELRFTPRALASVTESAFTDVIQWVCASVDAACRANPIDVRLIVSFNRHEGVDIAERVLAAALACAHERIVGVDLAGQEAGFSCLPFADVFARARDAGLGVTIHAGEWAGADSVAEAVDVCGATRIGHGIRVLEDDALVARLIEHEVVLEVCPTSNVHSGVVPSLEAHPLAALIRRGLLVTINTDDPQVSNLTLTDELVNVVRAGLMPLHDVITSAWQWGAAASLMVDRAPGSAWLAMWRGLRDEVQRQTASGEAEG